MEVLLYIAKSTLVLSIFYVTYHIILRRDTFFTAHRHYFLAGIIASILLPFVTFTQTIYIDIPVTSVTEFTEQGISYPIVSDTTAINIPTPTNWWQILYFCYGVGILFMGIRFMIQLKSLYKLIRKNKTRREEGFTHVQVNHPISPFSFFRHIVYNPNLHSTRELKMIITHEKVHGKQWHTIDMVLTQLLLIIQWVNPLAWLYRKSLEQNLEFIADNEAIEKVPSRKEYQMALVKCSSTQLQPALTNNFYHSLIKKRIVMLNKQASRKHNLLKLGIVLPLLAIFLYSFNVKKITAYNEVSNASDTIDFIDGVSAFAKAEDSKTTVTPVTENLSDNSTITKSQTINQNETTQNINPETAVKTLALNNSPVAITSGFNTISNNSNQVALASVLNTRLPKSDPAKIIAYTQVDAFKIKITKSTSDAELKKIKKELKEKHDVDLNYSVNRNANDEITSLNLQWSDAQGNSGNSNVNGSSPISDTYIFRDEDGSIGLSSGSQERQLRRRAERLEHRARELQERQVARVEELQHRMEERREELEERQVGRQQELKERMHRLIEEREEQREELQDQMNDRRRRLIEEREEQREELEDQMNDHRRRLIEEREEQRKELREEIEEQREHLRARHARAAREYAEISRRSNAQVIIITKDTSADEIKSIKNRLKGEGFSFSLTKVKRNDRGEIMSYKMTFNDNKGTSSTSTHKSSDNPIEPIRIAYADGSISIE